MLPCMRAGLCAVCAVCQLVPEAPGPAGPHRDAVGPGPGVAGAGRPSVAARAALAERAQAPRPLGVASSWRRLERAEGPARV